MTKRPERQQSKGGAARNLSIDKDAMRLTFPGKRAYNFSGNTVCECIIFLRFILHITCHDKGPLTCHAERQRSIRGDQLVSVAYADASLPLILRFTQDDT